MMGCDVLRDSTDGTVHNLFYSTSLMKEGRTSK